MLRAQLSEASCRQAAAERKASEAEAQLGEVDAARDAFLYCEAALLEARAAMADRDSAAVEAAGSSGR